MRRIIVHLLDKFAGLPTQKRIDHLLLLYAQFGDSVFNNNFDADQDLMLLTASLQVEKEPKWPRAFYDPVFRRRWEPPVRKEVDGLVDAQALELTMSWVRPATSPAGSPPVDDTVHRRHCSCAHLIHWTPLHCCCVHFLSLLL